MSYGFIMQYYYEKENTYYLEQGFLNRMLEKAKTDEDKQRISKTYDYLKLPYIED